MMTSNPRSTKIAGHPLHPMIVPFPIAFFAVDHFLRYAGDGDTVGSTGVVLSGVAVLLLLYTGWKGGELAYRHRVGVSDTDPTPNV